MINPFRRKDDPTDQPAPGGVPAPEGGAEQAGGEGLDVDQTAALLDQLQKDIETLRVERDALAAERDQAQAAWKHALADFQNYQRRAVQNEATAREQAVRGVLHSILPVIDHFEMALSHNHDSAAAGPMMAGVSMIKDELLRAVALHGVQVIKPEPGEAFDAARHKAIGHQPVPGVPAGHVALTARVGYALEGRVIRPAEVLVAAEPPADASPGQSS